MTATKTYYVVLGMRTVMKGQKVGRLVPASFVAEAGTPDGDWRSMVFENTAAVYEVECQAKSEPVDILVRWLATGRPRIMAVRELWTPSPKLVCDSCHGPVRVATGLHHGGYRHDNAEPDADAEFCETPDGYVRVKVDGRQSVTP